MKAFLFMLLPLVASAQEAVDPNMNQVVDAIFQAFSAGKVVAGVSGIVLILVFLFRKYLLPRLGLGNGILPYLAIILSAVIGLLGSILGGMEPSSAAQVILFSGPGAIAFWDAMIKLVTKKG
jgi:hypothetical protein